MTDGRTEQEKPGEELEDERYILSPWGILSCVLKDYGFDVSHISGKVGTHIVEDFMEEMVRNGYVRSAEEVEA